MLKQKIRVVRVGSGAHHPCSSDINRNRVFGVGDEVVLDVVSVNTNASRFSADGGVITYQIRSDWTNWIPVSHVEFIL
jgi:hypothetical protein